MLFGENMRTRSLPEAFVQCLKKSSLGFNMLLIARLSRKLQRLEITFL